MRRALGSNGGGGSLPTPSPMSASAPDSDRLGAVYASNYSPQQQHPQHTAHQPLSRSASALPSAGRADDRAGSRSRSALGLSTRPHASRSVAGPGDHTYISKRSQHPPRDPHSRSNHSYSGHSDHSDAVTVSSSPSTSALSVRADDTLVASAVELSPERRQMLVDFVDRSVDDAYNLCHGFGSVRWLPAKTREGVSIYRAKGGELSDDPRLDASVRGKCNVSASFDEMMDTMVTETTSDFVAHESSVNPAEFLDGQVLCTLVPRSRSDRFVCVKWHCIKSLAPSVAKHRDYVYVEVVDHFTDRDGRKVGFRLSKSVELEELEAFDHSEIFVRGKTLTLHTFSQVSPGNIELYTMMINDLGERLPAWLVHKIVDTAAMRSACLRDYINQKRMDLLVLARPKEMVPLHKRVCCVVCTRSFSLVRKKYNCVACGDVICNQCSVHQFVAPPTGTISDFVGKKKARICVQCSSNAKRRELPRRASSARASMLQAQQSPQPQHDGGLSEMDHRRVSGSTIGNSSKLQKQQSQYAQHLNRMMRSASSVEASNSTSSMHEEQGRVHPTDANGGSNRSTIPHMFQFRPAKNNASVLSAGRSSIRSSGMSTSRSSSSPDDDTMLHAVDAANAGNDDELSDDDDDQEYMIPGDAELEANGAAAAAAAAAVNGGDMDFDNLLDATALDSSNGANGSMDLGVGKYRASYTNAGTLSTDVSEDELTDADDEDTLTTPSTGSSGSAVSAALSPPPASTPLGDTEDDDGLIIQEVSPQNSFRQSMASSKGPTPRQSVVSMTTADDEVTIVKPMVVKQVRKRPAPGASARVIKTGIEITEVEPSRSPNAPELPPPRVNPMVESIVTQSRRATITEEPVFDNNADTEYNEANQLADLQVHLDRMTMIAESLKNLNQPAESPSKKMRPSTVSPAELQAQYAKISNIEMRAQEEAALAAGFAQAIMDEAQANAALASERMTISAGSMHQAEEMELSDDDYGDDEEIELMDLSLGSDVHFTREDGSFSGFLADSSFMDMASASPEGAVAVPGWVAVHSKTTGKVYFYNESVGTTSWTVPTPDTTRRSGSYMVL